jgi:isopentenyldiphosphate isomerase
MVEKTILVNHNDEQIGLMPKLEAHEKGFFTSCFFSLF